MKARSLPAASAAGALWPEVNNIPEWTISRRALHVFTLKFVQQLWQRGTFAEQAWLCNRDPWAAALNYSFWIEMHWFMGTCFVQYSNAGFSDQTCNMHPWTWSSQREFSNKRLEFLIIFGIQVYDCIVWCKFWATAQHALHSRMICQNTYPTPKGNVQINQIQFI